MKTFTWFEESWRLDAACQDSTPTEAEDWVGPVGNKPNERQKALAKKYCAVCPVRLECGTFAHMNAEVGVWAGVFRPADGNSKATVDLLTAEERAS